VNYREVLFELFPEWMKMAEENLGPHLPRQLSVLPPLEALPAPHEEVAP